MSFFKKDSLEQNIPVHLEGTNCPRDKIFAYDVLPKNKLQVQLRHTVRMEEPRFLNSNKMQSINHVIFDSDESESKAHLTYYDQQQRHLNLGDQRQLEICLGGVR